MQRFRGNLVSKPADDPYEVVEFANKFGLTTKAAEIILHANGPSRVACDGAARSFVQAVSVWQRDKD
ncbi:hypothetical protein B5V01_21240 [Mesorhizobium erdmanii]|uniref:DUF3606 domain-containing protein n=3 Tax=Mesorhizobium TaxID=68287 RepID=A0A3M9X0L5_9HYPH|nr:hypothetical protein DNR46_34290 [Mesorhizobium japonicum]RXT43073.1 hypothetical protein B5V01_21240 [Mesorhizobium erdmanii]